METHEEYKNLALRYTEIVQQIKEIQKEQADKLKNLKSEKEDVQQKLIQFLKENDSNQIKLDNCKIRFSTRQKTKPVKPENVLETTELVLAANTQTKDLAEKLVESISTMVEAEREVVEVESLAILKA